MLGWNLGRELGGAGSVGRCASGGRWGLVLDRVSFVIAPGRKSLDVFAQGATSLVVLSAVDESLSGAAWPLRLSTGR